MRIQFKLILVGFVTIAILAGAVGFVGIRSTQKAGEGFEKITHHTIPVLLALGKIEALVSKVHTEAIGVSYIYAELAFTEEGAAAAAAAEILQLEEAKEALEFWEDEFIKVATHEEDKIFVREIKEREATLYSAALALVRAKQDGRQGQEMLDLKEELEREEENFEELISRVIENERTELSDQDNEAHAQVSVATGSILAIGIIASTLLALGMGVFVSRSVAKPLKELQHVAARIIAGDYTVRAEVKGKDEIAELAGAFNAMTESLIASRRLPENILRSMKDSLFVVDTKGDITEVNEAALEALGYTKEELVGKPISKVFGNIANVKEQGEQKDAGNTPRAVKYVPATEEGEEDVAPPKYK
jgi:HAMP domain-containing protein